jgi:sterol desaturase/sphingolipid hydroxylase (fatty acid hydroxylase superfamily)
MLPDEFGALVLAQVAALALVQIWRAGRQASREELGNHPRPRHDAVHLIFTGLAIILGLVLLTIWVAHPVILPNLARGGNILVPVIAFLTFIYIIIIFVVGISSSRHTSGDQSNPWLSALSLFAAAVLLLAAMVLPMFLLPHTQVPERYQRWLALLIGVAAVAIWHVIAHRLQHRNS